MNLREAKELVRKHDTGLCDKFYQTSRSTWVCLKIWIRGELWYGDGKAVYNPGDAKDRRLQWNAGRGYNIARGRAVADIARKIVAESDAAYEYLASLRTATSFPVPTNAIEVSLL